MSRACTRSLAALMLLGGVMSLSGIGIASAEPTPLHLAGTCCWAAR
jgi:hypothetical protein